MESYDRFTAGQGLYILVAVLNYLPFDRTVFAELEKGECRVKSPESATPPVAAYSPVAVVLYAFIFHCILQVNVATKAGTDVFVLGK